MRTASPPLPAADDLQTHRLVLRDGSVAIVRPAGPSDRGAMRRFFHELSPESRRHRFFIAGEPPDAVVDRFCTAADPAESLTLIACRRSGDDERIVAAASYFRITDTAAEAAFAVDDRLHGKGIARCCWSGWQRSPQPAASHDSGHDDGREPRHDRSLP